MGITAFADDKPEFTIGKVYAVSGEVSVPVYITGIPETVTNIMAIDLEFSFDDTMLEFVKAAPGTASGSLFNFSLNSADPSIGKVSWADATNISENEPKVTYDTIGKDNPLFTLIFNITGSGKAYTDIVAEKVGLTSANLLSADQVEIVVLTDKYYTVKPGRIIHKEDPNAGTPGAGSDENGSGEVIGGGTDNVTNPDDGTDDENEGDNTGDVTGGENGDTTDTPDDKEDSSDNDNTDGGNTDNGNTSGGNEGGTGLKPNNQGTNNNGAGAKPSGGKPSGNTGFGGGIAVIPQTPAEPGQETTKPTKVSEVFSDVADDHWAASYALILYNGGIVSGDSSKRANLENKITREETSKLALLVNGIEADASLVLDVTDALSVSDWAKSFMATAIREGIFSGYEDGTVRPLNHITREEMVTVIIKSLKIDVDTEAAVSFADGDRISWSAPYVAKAVELGFVNGYSDNTFKPENPITRAEAFTIFARVLEYKGK